MATDSKIGWTDHTANLWWGCVEVSPLCDNCYAREWAARYDRAKWGAKEPRLAIKGVWADLAKWQRDAAAKGIVYRVFCGSMMDIFEKPMPVVNAKGEDTRTTTDYVRRCFFSDVVPQSPNLLFLLLTKRPGNIIKYVPPEWMENPPRNVMCGYSVGTQKGVGGILKLLEWPGRRFLSMEPMLEDVDVTRVRIPKPRRKPTIRRVMASAWKWCEARGIDTLISTDGGRGPIIPVGGYLGEVNPLTGQTIREDGVGFGGEPLIEQVITGIESRGSRAGRFADGYEATARRISQQCRRAGVLYFNKQMPINGRVSHDPGQWPEDLRTQQVPTLEVQPV